MGFAYSPEARQEAIQRVLDGLANGTPLSVICASSDLPCENTIRDWAETDPELSAGIARARDLGWDKIALDAQNIIDEKPELAISADGSSRLDPGYIAWAKNRAWVRLELLKKWDPKRYGEMLKHANADGENIDLASMIATARSRAEQG